MTSESVFEELAGVFVRAILGPPVDLSGCTFRGALNSGDEVESHAVYRKDLICNGALFEGAISFNSCRVEGSACFSGATFRSRNKPADFGAFSVEKTFECEGSTFGGPASFAALKSWGTGFFAGCSFELLGSPSPELSGRGSSDRG